MKKKDEIKVCLVGSSGGHLTHLYMLKPFWKDKNRFWVTFDKEDAPCILYDLDGYYTGLRMLLGHMIETGLSSEERQKGIYFAKDLAEIKAILNR